MRALDGDGWLRLVVAGALLTADPIQADPEWAPQARAAAHAVKTVKALTDLVRRNAMKSGVWPELEPSILATTSVQSDIALEAVTRLHPGLTGEELLETLPTYAEPVSGLAHALRLRPCVSEDEFMLLWGIYEMSDSDLAQA